MYAYPGQDPKDRIPFGRTTSRYEAQIPTRSLALFLMLPEESAESFHATERTRPRVPGRQSETSAISGQESKAFPARQKQVSIQES